MNKSLRISSNRIIFSFLFSFLLTTVAFGQKEKSKARPDITAPTSIGFDFDLCACPTLDMTIHDGLAGYSGGDPVSGTVSGMELEESRGAVTVANKNDTDGDTVIDNVDMDGVHSIPVGTPGAGRGRDEIDLMKFIIRASKCTKKTAH